MIKELHIAAQYLAASAINFVEKRDDDSHTNLSWSNESYTLFSRSLTKEGDKLALDFSSYSLVWYTNKGIVNSLGLEMITHTQVLEWINSQLKASGIKSDLKYAFHYDLGYGIEMDDYSFPEVNHDELKKISNYFSVAQNAMQEVLEKENLASEIKVWPHHFDLGAYVVVDDNLSLGFGIAIPDSAINDFYYYISGYKGHDSLATKSFEKIENGEWQTGDWKAGTLKATNIAEHNVVQFFNETIGAYSKKYK